MDSSGKDLPFITEFKAATLQDWQKTAAKELAGADPFEKLSFSLDFLKFTPYYDASAKAQLPSIISPSQDPFLGARAWTNQPRIVVSQHAEANKQALHALSNGADGVLFESDLRSTDFTILLQDIDLRYCTVSFLLHNASVADLESAKIHLDKFADAQVPAGAVFATNALTNINAAVWTRQRPLGVVCRSSHPVGGIVEFCSQIIATMEKIPDSASAAEVLRQFAVMIPVDTDFFFSIAKLKALRLVWNRMVQAYGISEEIALPIHVVVSGTGKDSMIKNTTMTLSAVLGGCSAVTVDADDAGNTTMTRVARNVATILREEAHLSKVADPTAGSYYIDTLISTFATTAWKKIIEA